MRKQQLLMLTRINLLYANPQMTDKARKKGKTGGKLTRYLLWQYGLSGLTFILIYGVAMFTMDFSQMPGFFTYYVALFGILGFSQGISAIYNVFFESQDLMAYLPLPFRQTEIFAAKISVVFLTVAPFVFPMMVLFLLTGVRASLFFVVTIAVSILLFLFVLVILFSICSLIVFGLTRTKFFLKHKKLVTTLLLVVTMIVVMAGVLMMNQVTSYDTEILDRGAIVFLLPFYYAMTTPFHLSGVLSFVGIIGLAVLLVGALYWLILPKFFEQVAAAAPNQGNLTRKHKKGRNLSQLLFNYNSQLIRDPNLIMQVFSSSLLMPIVFLLSFVFTGVFRLDQLDERFLGVMFVAGGALAVLMVNPTSFVSNLISLDQENFLFVRSLPLSMKTYLKAKFHFGLLIQIMLAVVVAVVAMFLLQAPFVLGCAFVLGAIWSTILISSHYFARDYRLLLLQWTNISQLFARGAGSVGLALVTMGTIFLAAIVIGAYAFAATIVDFWLLNLPVCIALLVITLIVYLQIHLKFWRRFS